MSEQSITFQPIKIAAVVDPVIFKDSEEVFNKRGYNFEGNFEVISSDIKASDEKILAIKLLLEPKDQVTKIYSEESPREITTAELEANLRIQVCNSLMARLDLGDIRQEIKEAGWILISTDYKNLNEPLVMGCPRNHEVRISLAKWRKNKLCPQCTKKLNKAEIKAIIPTKVSGKRRTLALDAATSNSGWALYDDEVLISFGKINLQSFDVIERIQQMKDWLKQSAEKWSPDIIVLEDIQLQQGRFANVNTFKVLAQLQGVLLVAARDLKIETQVILSTVWRSSLSFRTKTRADQKREAQKLVLDWYGVECTQDEADAICVGRHSVQHYLSHKLTKW